MQAVFVSAAPIGGCVIAVLGKPSDAAGVVVGAVERVLDLPGEILVQLAAVGQFQGVGLYISFGLYLPHLSQIWIGPGPTAVQEHGGVGVNGTERANSTIADVGRTERGLRGDLPLHPDAVLQGVGNLGTRVENDHAYRGLRERGRSDRVRNLRWIDDEAQQVLPVEVQQISDRTGAGAVVKHSAAAADHGLALPGWSPGETHPGRKIVGIIMKIVLPVVAHSKIERKVGKHADIIFKEPTQHSLEERDVTSAGLQEIGGGTSRGKIRGALEGVSAATIGEIVEAAAADIRHIDSETDLVLAVSIGREVGAVEVILRAAGIR